MLQYINKLQNKEDLSVSESKFLVEFLLSSATELEVKEILCALAIKGESYTEIIGFVNAIRSKSKNQIELSNMSPCIDIVGTGGDNSNTYNISTASALLLSSCGVSVVKHGNRAVTSQCGTADVLEALGYNIHMQKDELIQSLSNHNFAFCFAPDYYPILAKLRNIRKELKIPTIFNLIGPLLNPLSPEYIIIGVNRLDKVQLICVIITFKNFNYFVS